MGEISTTFGSSILTWITFLPIIGMILLAIVPTGKDDRSKEVSALIFRWGTVFVTFVQLILAIIIFLNFDKGFAGVNTLEGFQFIEKVPWIKAAMPLVGNINIDYFVGIDGISVPMVLLTAIVCFAASFASFGIKKSIKGYFAMYLLLDAGMMGVFVSLDFFLFYVFWELMLLPMYFLIGIWGGPRKEYAAIKFFLYTLVGSVFMLLVMIALYFAVGSFNMLDMMDQAKYNTNSILSIANPENWRNIAFFALFVGFAIKVPAVPFHTWLPDAHVEAPTAISVILAGVLLKMGTYGILRINFSMFPDSAMYFQEFMAIVGMVSIIYGAYCALGQFKVGQRDLKKMIAYSSVSHMGYVMLGMSSLHPSGVVGAIFQMFNHGTITAMLFMIVGVVYDRSHKRGLDDFGGLANKMPIYTGIMTIAFFAAIGLPGMSGFVSEVLVLLGSFSTYPVYTAISGLGIILGASYMLWALQKVFFGKLPEKWSGPWDPTGKIYKHDDVNLTELAALVPLAIIVIFLGIMPNYMISVMDTTVNHFVQFVTAIPVSAGL
jgi:NADH-quinone oxidoreductase subunit M